jgi:sulfhydrogenase subunit beta (sulfur reductase)
MKKSTPPPNPKVIHQTELESCLDVLAQRGILIAPRQDSDTVLYRHVAASGEIAWGNARPLLPMKDVFFPPTEHLLSIKKIGKEIQVKETLPGDQVVIFGVRPCDGRGTRLLDALFIDHAPADPYYSLRRENTTLIGLACQEMGASCFCTSVGGAPDDPTGMDLMLTPVPGGYLAEAITERGHALLTEMGWPETVSGGSKASLEKQFPLPVRAQWIRNFNSDLWAKLSEGCLSCRTCAYVCPTCRCFAVRDEAIGPDEFERIRCWDSCAGENYRRVAGGHRPRPEKGERLRNRFNCKFFYFPEQVGLDGMAACTGCGRCIDACPAGVDITEVLLALESQA